MYKESQSHGLDVFDLPIVIRNLLQQTVSRRISLTNFRIEGFMQVLSPLRCFCHQSTVTCVERCCADPPWLVFFFFIHEPRFDDIILSANSPSKENHFETIRYPFKRRDSQKRFSLDCCSNHLAYFTSMRVV